MLTKQEKARRWVNGYTIAGTAAVVAAAFPATTSAALATIEGTMCYQIGKIYRGKDYTFGEAVAAASMVGLASIMGQLLALETLNLIPFAGWVAKATIAGGVIKSLGEVIIEHYEGLEDESELQQA